MANHNAINNYSYTYRTYPVSSPWANIYFNLYGQTFDLVSSMYITQSINSDKHVYFTKETSGSTFEYAMSGRSTFLAIASISTADPKPILAIGTCIGSNYFTMGLIKTGLYDDFHIAFGAALDTKIITISYTQGNFLLNLQPCFLAYNSSLDADQTGNGTVATVDEDTEVFDKSSDFASDTFTASVDGKYFLQGTVTLSDITSADDMSIQIVTTNRTYYSAICSPTACANGSVDSGLICFNISCLADMEATETAVLKIVSSGEGADNNDIDSVVNSITSTYFSGYLAC